MEREEENVLAMSSTSVETRPIFCIHSWPVHADPCFPNLRPFLREDRIVSSLDAATLAIWWKTDPGNATCTANRFCYQNIAGPNSKRQLMYSLARNNDARRVQRGEVR